MRAAEQLKRAVKTYANKMSLQCRATPPYILKIQSNEIVGVNRNTFGIWYTFGRTEGWRDRTTYTDVSCRRSSSIQWRPRFQTCFRALQTQKCARKTLKNQIQSGVALLTSAIRFATLRWADPAAHTSCSRERYVFTKRIIMLYFQNDQVNKCHPLHFSYFKSHLADQVTI